jgi:hypothetical protein
MRRKLTAVFLATMLLVTAFTPAAVSAQETEPTDLDVTLVQTPETGNATVTVTNGSVPVEGATVTVTSGVTYTGAGTYTTDSAGTVELPNPDQPLDIDVEVTHDNVTTTETFTLVPVENSINVRITQNDDGTVVLETTQYGDVLADAEVEVTSTVAYGGDGTDTTDANGTVELPEPANATEITAVVTTGDLEAVQTDTVEPIAEFEVGVEPNGDGTATVTVTRNDNAVENATVNVTSDVAYDGNGTYTTNADGMVGLSAPDRNVTVTVTATNGSETTTATADLASVENGGYANFGLWISSYVQDLKSEGYFGKEFGQKVSEFATENNPGADNRPDRAGPPEKSDTASEGGDTAKSNEGASGEEKRRGPPEHAGDAKDDETEEAESTDDSNCDVDSDEECDEEADERGAEEDNDDAPGKSGSRGNGGNGGSAGNGNGPKR